MKIITSFLKTIILVAVLLCAGFQGSLAGPIFNTDFNASSPWTGLSGQISGASLTVQASWKTAGTIDVAKTTDASGAIVLSVATGTSKEAWTATLSSGIFAVTNTVTNLGLLTLSFDHSVSDLRSVTVQIESFDASKTRTGGLEGQVEPAAADFFIRSAVDLSAMHAFGTGTFNPADPFIRINFIINSLPTYQTGNATQELRIDNVAYCSPAYYVKPDGNNSLDGKTEATAFKTVQTAINAMQPGDIIVVMDGTYEGGGTSVANIQKTGKPDKWLVLKNYPGHKPKFTTTDAWSIVNIGKGSKTTRYTGEAFAYIEVRGLWIRGKIDSTVVNEGKLWMQNNPTAVTLPSEGKWNTNGIGTNGYYMDNGPHHIRFADNLVEYVPAAGVGTLETDWVQIENNVVRNCCWTNIYGCSNIGTLGAYNFDATADNYRILVRNNISSGCRSNFKCLVGSTYRITDGNGIIIDVNQNTANRPNEKFVGRTLVQNNLCFNNGGSGIHTVSAYHVDIINNTAYLNSASPELQYSQMYTYSSQDVNFINNILVAPIANTGAGETAEPVNKLGGNGNANVTFSNNIYFGGNIAPTMGNGDKIADPMFGNPSRDPAVADFHLRANSPAIAAGSALYSFLPRLDLDGKLRRENAKMPDIGAYEYNQSLKTSVTEKTTSSNQTNIFPNPASNSITVMGALGSKIKTVQLLSLSGKVIKTFNAESCTEYNFDINFLSEGIYLLKINGGETIKKLIKI